MTTTKNTQVALTNIPVGASVTSGGTEQFDTPRPGHAQGATMFTLDNGDAFTLEQFKADNPDGIDREWSEVEAMAVGDVLALGGGASADFVLRRVA